MTLQEKLDNLYKTLGAITIVLTYDEFGVKIVRATALRKGYDEEEVKLDDYIG